MAPLCLVHVLTQRKRKMAANGAFSQTLIFFQNDFFTTFRARRMQRSQRATIQGKKYQRHKKHFQTFLKLQTFLYSTRAQCSAFSAQKLGQHYQKDYCIARILIVPTCLYTMVIIHTFPLSFMGGLMRMKIAILTRKSNSR